MISKKKVFNRTVNVYDSRPKNLDDLFMETVNQYPNKEALVMNQIRITYREMEEQVEKIAINLFHHFNLQKGDRIALLLGGCIEYSLLVFAAARIGVIIVPLNTGSGEEELLFRLNHSGTKMVITDQELIKKVEPIREKHSHEIQEVESFILIGDADSPYEKKGYTPFVSLLCELDERILIPYEVEEEDPLFIMYTSGTTGLPKGAIGSHIGVIHSVMNYQKVMKTNDQTITLIAVPLFHVTGLIAQLIHVVFVGGTSILMKRFNTDQFLQSIERERVTFLLNVPTIYILMLANPLVHLCSLESLETVAYGGAPMPPDTVYQLRKLIPSVKLHNVYGATETCSPTTISPTVYSDAKLNSVGKAVPVAELLIVNERQNEVGRNEVGELFIKGPMVISGYWNNEEANQKSFTNDYWASGDLARMDEDGFVYIVDRKKDMINRGGEKIYTAELESFLYSHPSILEVAVVGIPDKIFGAQVAAFIVRREKTLISKEEVQTYVCERLADYKKPEEVVFLERLPRNPGGKVIKDELISILHNHGIK